MALQPVQDHQFNHPNLAGCRRWGGLAWSRAASRKKQQLMGVAAAAMATTATPAWEISIFSRFGHPLPCRRKCATCVLLDV